LLLTYESDFSEHLASLPSHHLLVVDHETSPSTASRSMQTEFVVVLHQSQELTFQVLLATDVKKPLKKPETKKLIRVRTYQHSSTYQSTAASLQKKKPWKLPEMKSIYGGCSQQADQVTFGLELSIASSHPMW
jgi:hypothetical protein